MPKPQWLKDREAQAQRVMPEPDLCCDCIHYGKLIKYVKYKNKIMTELHECDINPGCMNTKFSICCEDWKPKSLI